MDLGLSSNVLSFPPLPPEVPLSMPTQSLREKPMGCRRPASSPSGIGLRRFLVVGGAVVLSAIATYEMYLVLAGSGFTTLAAFMLLLFVALFSWIALSFTSSLAGFVSVLVGGGRRLLSSEANLPTTRTALLMPTYNESPARVMGGLQAIEESLRAAGASDPFDLFILSDTTDPEIWIAEEAAFLSLRERTGGHHRIFYRHRKQNVARKAGNIADWVRRWGGRYPQFLILDADSVMTADALLRLVVAMERHPDVGLIQTLPIITAGTTLLARLQQFASRVYGPLIAHGLAWWHGAEGNYWGHNALIRTRAFAEQAGLPVLQGPTPFGGHILSHDFVEAALIRRGGWAAHMVPGLPGSYETGPPSLIELTVRDRRWCQGNLQHAAVLPARGLAWISRLHLLTGIGSYITAPLWVLFLLTGILIALQARFVPYNYFPGGKSLFPTWPVIDPVRAMWMFIGTMAVLLAPKLLAAIAVLVRASERRGHGGAARLLMSVATETILTGLIAPVMMLSQSGAVCGVLLGRDSGWQPQRRDDGSVPIGELARRYKHHTVLGLLLGSGAWTVSPYLALWMTPVVVGLVLAIPVAAVTGQRRIGLALRKIGLLCTPEETTPPSVLVRATELGCQLEQDKDSDVLARLLDDPNLLAAHVAMLPPPRRPRIDPIDATLLVARTKLNEARSLKEVWGELTRLERLVVLTDQPALERLVALRLAKTCEHQFN